MQIADGKIFRDLRIERSLETTDKLLDGRLYLNCNSPGGIDNGAEEYVEHHIEALRVKDGSQVSEKTPACKTGHLFQQRLVDLHVQMGLLEMLMAVLIIDEPDQQLDGKEKKCIGYQPVDRRNDEEKDYDKFQRDFENRDVGKGGHPGL